MEHPEGPQPRPSHGREEGRTLLPGRRKERINTRQRTVSKGGGAGKDSQQGMESKSGAGECADYENEVEKYAACPGQQPGNLPKEQGGEIREEMDLCLGVNKSETEGKKGHFAVDLFLVVASEGTLQSPPFQPTTYLLHMAKSVSPRARPQVGGGEQLLERPAHLQSLAYSLSHPGRVGWLGHSEAAFASLVFSCSLFSTSSFLFSFLHS